MPAQIRFSLGTAKVLGLLDCKLAAEPTTAYLMTHKIGKCSANCGFCPQARGSKSNSIYLSRVTWPTFPTEKALQAIADAAEQGKIRRVCIQALNYPEVFFDLEALVNEIKKQVRVPVSVSCQPLNKANILLLKEAGVDRLGVALDAATESVFNKVKGKEVGGTYTWENQFRQLCDALEVFGAGNVSTHVIVGLGETEKEAAQVVQRCMVLGVLPALFAFTPVRGTAFEGYGPPQVASYRRVQLARYLIVSGEVGSEGLQFDSEGKITGFGVTTDKLDAVIESGRPFQTSGCPDCNRPYYNEKPSGPIYNYPTELNQKEIETVKKQLFNL